MKNEPSLKRIIEKFIICLEQQNKLKNNWKSSLNDLQIMIILLE